jgi:hypothetical protein
VLQISREAQSAALMHGPGGPESTLAVGVDRLAAGALLVLTALRLSLPALLLVAPNSPRPLNRAPAPTVARR